MDSNILFAHSSPFFAFSISVICITEEFFMDRAFSIKAAIWCSHVMVFHNAGSFSRLPDDIVLK